ncbi:hypothetical protein GGF50DRAFT_62008, partial [Schizophyllum commune]
QPHWCVGHKSFENAPAGKDTAWLACADLVVNFDTTTCQIFREEIETLMVFAGLFSGVCTAFIVESYRWLMVQPDDIAADYLRQILAVLSNTNIPAGATASGRPSLPDGIMALINGLWFSSLAMSLSSALIGIVSKQWLREYLRDAGRSQTTNLSVRQVKYEGLTRWYVGLIITAIPLLLQAALFLFLVGVVYLLWHLQPAVAGVISGIGILIVTFFIATTILPAAQFVWKFNSQDLHKTIQLPFKSAQSLLFLRMVLFLVNSAAWLYHASATTMGFRFGQSFVAPFPTFTTWHQLDLDWTRRRDESARRQEEPTSIGLCLGFMEMNFEHHLLRDWIWNCLRSLTDDAAVNAKYVLQCARRLPKIKAIFPSAEDGLANEVLPLLDPKMLSSATTELVSYLLLESSSVTCVEHIIRMYNSLVDRDVEDIPDTLYNSLRTTLDDLSGHKFSDGTPLFYVARTILRRCRHTEGSSSPFLKLVTTIITRLSHQEVEGGTEVHCSARYLSLELAPVIMDWLERYPNPDDNWRAYKSRVLWAEHSSVQLARRVACFASLDKPPAWHPRLPGIYALLEAVDSKACLIPPGTLPTWQPTNKVDTDELTRVKELFYEALEIGPDIDTASVRMTRQERPPWSQDKGMPSSVSLFFTASI